MTRPRADSPQAIPQGLRLGVDVFSLGQAAAMLGVATAGLRKACIAGRLPCYTVSHAGSLEHRRIRRDDLVAYAAERGIPLGPYGEPVRVAVLCRPPGVEVVTAFELGLRVARGVLAVVLVGCDEGYDRAVLLAREVRAAARNVRLGLWLSPDRTVRAWDRGKFNAVFPADANGELTEFLKGG